MLTENKLNELKQLHAEAAGTPYKAKDCWIYAQSVSQKRTFSRRPMAYTIDNRDGKYKPTETAAYIVAACNTLPELITENQALRKKMQEIEKQLDWLAEVLQNECEWYKNHGSCPVNYACPKGDYCLFNKIASKEDWIQAAKEAKEWKSITQN